MTEYGFYIEVYNNEGAYFCSMSGRRLWANSESEAKEKVVQKVKTYCPQFNDFRNLSVKAC